MLFVILAAGSGSRLMPLTRNTPKMLLDLGDGTTLLERQIDTAIHCGLVSEIVIVSGYLSDQVESKIQFFDKLIPIRVLYNPFYDTTNNLVSVWCTHHLLYDRDFIISNGDNIYEHEVLDTVLAHSRDTIQLTVDRKACYDEDDMKVQVGARNEVVRIGKDLDPRTTDFESIGLALVRGDKRRKQFVRTLLGCVRHKINLNRFWLEIFNSIANDGGLVETMEVPRESWREMDFHPDVSLIRDELSKRLFGAQVA